MIQLIMIWMVPDLVMELDGLDILAPPTTTQWPVKLLPNP